MSVEIAWKQNILVTDFHLLKSLLVVFGFSSQAFVCGFSRQNISSVVCRQEYKKTLKVLSWLAKASKGLLNKPKTLSTPTNLKQKEALFHLPQLKVQKFYGNFFPLG